MRWAILPDDKEILRLYEQAGGLVRVSRLLRCNERRIRRILIANGVPIEPRGKHLRYYPRSAELNARIASAQGGLRRSKEFCQHQSLIKKGHVVLEATRAKLRIAARKKIGCLNPNWRGGVTSLNETIRKSGEYKAWREAVFARDNYTCQSCGQWGGVLCADHIRAFSTHPELRFDLSNGRTLCRPCHLATPTYAGRLQQRKEILCAP